MTLAELRARWEHRAAEYSRLGVLLDGAKLAAEILGDLHELEEQDADETLTLTDAARELDMHPDSVGRAITSTQRSAINTWAAANHGATV